MAVKTLRLRRADVCAACDAALAAGTEAQWDGAAKTVTCLTCASAPVPAISGTAGASAAREYERRSTRERRRKEKAVAEDAAWRASIKAERPVLGRIATALTPKPVVGPESQSTRAWTVGAAGEARVGEVLAGCTGIRVLHDRRIPGSKANIDHLVVASTGIYVIDAKKYAGDVELRDKGSWLRPDVRLYVNGRDQSKLVAGVIRQVEVVLRVLADEVPVRGVLCFVDGLWPRFGRRPLTVGTVTALWPAALAELVQRPGDLVPDRIDRITEALAVALPSCV